jgi:pyruvate/2-oxoglutarate dehydrogenase complex dihydrolipoamide dehydrogenase (E3) component
LGQVQHLLIVGGSPETVAIAQSLAKLGIQVTLLVSGGLLPAESFAPETVNLLQAQLERDGVEVLVDRQIQRLQQQAQKITVKATHNSQWQELTIDALLIGFITNQDDAVSNQPLNALNLAAARVRHAQGLIYIDRYQRANRRIYACQSGGNDHAVWVQSARSAALHALKLPNQALNATPKLQLTTVLSQPTLVSIGLKAADQGRAAVLERPLYPMLKAQLDDQTTGLCQMRVRSDGKIIGADILGAGAEEWAGPIVLAIQQGLTIEQLANTVLPSPSWAAILIELAREYRRQVPRTSFWQYALEEFFSWRRYWGK